VSLLTKAKKKQDPGDYTDYQNLQRKFDIKIYPFGGRGSSLVVKAPKVFLIRWVNP
jgi:hypothetical protein